jgi:hypothetical protein
MSIIIIDVLIYHRRKPIDTLYVTESSHTILKPFTLYYSSREGFLLIL